MTRHEFVERYRKGSGLTKEQMRGFVPVEINPGECDYDGCEGWHMLRVPLIEQGVYSAVERGAYFRQYA